MIIITKSTKSFQNILKYLVGIITVNTNLKLFFSLTKTLILLYSLPVHGEIKSLYDN